MIAKGPYNGWHNYQTWNVALWLQNSYDLYHVAVAFMKAHPTSRKPYSSFIRYLGMENDFTGDHIKWLSSRLCYSELNAMMRELAPKEALK